MTEHDLRREPATLLKTARLRFGIVALAVPLVITAIGVALILAWMPDLPDPVAIHWGTTGVDGFGPTSTYLWLMIGVGLGIPVLLAVMTFATGRESWGATARFMGGLAAGMSAFALVLCLGSVALQRGLEDATQTPGIGGVIAVAFPTLLLVGAAAWAMQPRVDATPGAPLESTRAIEVVPGQRVVWVATTAMPRPVLWGLAAVLVANIALSVFLFARDSSSGWVSVIALAAVAGAVAVTAAFRVRITPEAFSARSLLGIPRVTIPVAQVTAVRAREINPFAEFGGWGWRISTDGRQGIVLRRGAAIEVSRAGRRPFVVTIDRADEAAALLQAYVDARPDQSVSERGESR